MDSNRIREYREYLKRVKRLTKRAYSGFSLNAGCGGILIDLMRPTFDCREVIAEHLSGQRLRQYETVVECCTLDAEFTMQAIGDSDGETFGKVSVDRETFTAFALERFNEVRGPFGLSNLKGGGK